MKLVKTFQENYTNKIYFFLYDKRMNKTSKDILRSCMPRPTWHEGMPRPSMGHAVPTQRLVIPYRRYLTCLNMPHVPRDHGSKWHTKGLDTTAWSKSHHHWVPLTTLELVFTAGSKPFIIAGFFNRQWDPQR